MAVPSEERTIELIKLYQENSSQEAWDELIVGHRPLAIHWARRYMKMAKSHELEDLINEGIMGLMQVIPKYDSSYGNKFTTYASYWIRQKIVYAIDYRDEMIHSPKRSGVESPAAEAGFSPDWISANTNDSDQLIVKMDCEIVLARLKDKREKRVIREYYFKYKTLHQIAGKLGISRERVRQIKKTALKRMNGSKKWQFSL